MKPLTGIVLLLLVLSASQATAEEGLGLQVGPLIGGGFSQISAPSDPPGSTTFMYGTAFSGGSFTIGLDGILQFRPVVGLEVDLLYSYHNLSGFARSDQFRREVSFGLHALRLDILARLSYPVSLFELELALGPEVALGLAANAEEVLEGFVDPSPPLDATPSIALIPVVQVGVTTDLETVEVPLLVRFTFNPFYPDTTAERFDGFNGPEDPGAFIVGYDWALTVMAGARFEL